MAVEENNTSNYETAKRQAAQIFLKYDQEAMCRKFSLRFDDDYLYIVFFSRLYRITRKDGLIQWSDDQFAHPVEAGFNEALTIYDVLCDSRENSAISGEFVNMQSLSRLQSSSGSGTLGGGMFDRIAGSFFGKEAELARACERLGGTVFGKADVSYKIPMFPFFPVVFQYWGADEDFPASIQFLMDKNTPQFLRFETLWYAVSHLLERLREEMENHI